MFDTSVRSLTGTSDVPSTDTHLTPGARITSTNPFINGLVDPTPWSINTLTFFLKSNDINKNGVDDWSENGAAEGIKSAFAAWSAVSNLEFKQVFVEAGANFVESVYSSPFLGEHFYPAVSPTGTSYGYYSGTQSVWTADNNKIGGYSYITFLHELGHGLGLEHPHEPDDGDTFPGVTTSFDIGDNGLNQGVWTAMTYNDGWDVMGTPPFRDWGWEGTPMAFDIAAIQFLYGANMTAHTGADTYVLASKYGPGSYLSCIWDAGGTDIIDNSASLFSSIIDLRPAPLVGVNAGGYVSYNKGVYGGFTIANGVTIENATGGTRADVITGNDVANLLKGGGGGDTINGGLGSDTMQGGAGDDTYVIDSSFDIVDESVAGSTGADTVRSSNLSINLSFSSKFKGSVENAALDGNAALSLTGNGLDNRLTGNSGVNLLDGGGGMDTLDGKGGGDTMRGFTGNDTYYVDSSSDIVDESVAGSNGSDTARSSNISINLGLSNNFRGTIESAVLEGTANLNLTGNGLVNYLQGNAGANILNGGAGSDTLIGLGGNDIFRFANSIGSTNIDRITDYNVAQDRIELDNSYFSALVDGFLYASAFVANTTGLAQDASDRIIYETDTGKLFYDSNGSASGGTYQQFAQLSAGLSMSAGEFLVI